MGDIYYYCQYHHLPPLTSIVVEQKTGLPHDGFPDVAQIAAVQEEVFKYPWVDVVVPRFDDFAAAREAMTNGTNQQPSELATTPSTDAA